MKKDWVMKDKNYHVTGLKQISEDFRYNQIIKEGREFAKQRDKRLKKPELEQLGCEIYTECYRDKVYRKYKKKRGKRYKKI
jgi:hypothetical protein